jgi:hypothetical protein
MGDGTRWRLVPSGVGRSLLLLLAGAVAAGSSIWQMADAGEVAVLPLLAAVLGAAVVVVSVIGLLRS